MRLKIDTIEIEGVDKTGKDLLMKYINYLSDFKYNVHSRGLISNTAYEIIYNRERNERLLNNHTLYVLLTADKEDLDIRFKITGEPKIDIDKESRLFESIFKEMTKDFLWLEMNTSWHTPLQIANRILRYIEEINTGDIKK